jgi:hypothetical protein
MKVRSGFFPVRILYQGKEIPAAARAVEIEGLGPAWEILAQDNPKVLESFKRSYPLTFDEMLYYMKGIPLPEVAK